MIRFLIMLKIFTHIFMSLLYWRRILFPGPNHPAIPNLRAGNDRPYFESWTRGKIVVGSPGSGKTEKEARDILDYVIENEKKYLAGDDDRNAVFILDASGSIVLAFLRMVHLQPEPMRSRLLERIVLDILGHPEYVVPFPFIHPDYGTNEEEQTSRIQGIYETLYSEIMIRTPIMALAIREMLPQFLRLLSVIKDQNGDPAQIGKIKELIADKQQLRRMVRRYGQLVPSAGWYFNRDYFPLSKREKELRSHALRAALSNVGSRFTMPRVNYPNPAWTPKEADTKGLIVLVSGEHVINQEAAQAVLFTDVFTQILAHVNRRIPHDPRNKPLLLIIDEVPMLLQIKGMARQIFKVSPQYRSRKVQIIVMIQALWQIEKDIREQIWSLGNVTCYRVDDFDEAYKIAQQLFRYDPLKTKLPAAHESGQPILETDRGAFLEAANWIQHLDHRECVMKKYISESTEEKFVSYVKKTRDNPFGISDRELQNLKEDLLKRRAIPIKEALRVITPPDPTRPSV